MKTYISVEKQHITASPLPALPRGPGAPVLDKAYEILLDALGFEPPSANAQYNGPACRALTKRSLASFPGFAARPDGMREGRYQASHMGSLR